MSTPVPPPYQPSAPDTTGATPAPASTPPPAYPGQAVPSLAAPGAYPPGPASQNQPAPARRGFAIAAMVLAIVPLTALVGFVMSIIAMTRGGRTSNNKVFGIVGIVVGAVWLGVGLNFSVGAWNMLQTCQDLGPGVHTVDGYTYNCG